MKIHNSLRSDRFDMPFNEKFDPLRFTNSLQSRPGKRMEEGAWDTVRKEVCTSMNFPEGKSGGKKSGFMLDW